MTPGIGYITQGDPGVSYPNTYIATFTGSKINTGDINISVTHNTDGDSDNDWNLIGNPYASAINADTFLEANSSLIGGTLYFWSHSKDASFTQDFSQNDYVSWNGTGGTAGCGGCKAPDNAIASGQGFFALAVATGTAKFTNAMRLSGKNTNFYKTAEIVEDDKIWLNLSGENSFSQILVGFLEDATDGVDQKYDGLRLDAGTGASFYSIIEERPYGIQAKSSLKNVEEIPLGIKSSLAGNFTISIDHLQGQLKESTVYIVDKVANLEHNLKDGDYTFYIDGSATEYNDRFVLKILTNIVVEDPTSPQLIVIKKGNELKIGTSNLDVIATVKVYDIYGIEIASYTKKPKTKISLPLKNFKSKTILIIKAVLVSQKVLTQKQYSE